MQKSSDPDLLKLCQNDYLKVIKGMQKFVNDIAKGNNRDLQDDLLKNLQKFVKVAQLSVHSKANEVQKRSKRYENEAAHIDSAQNKTKLEIKRKFELPDEVWLKIIRYLKTKDLFSNFGLVSKHFNNLTKDPNILIYLELKDFITFKTEKHKNEMIKFLNNAKKLTEIKIKCYGDWKIMDSIIQIVLTKQNQLKSIKILSHTGTELSERVTQMMVNEKDKKALEHLEISKFQYRNPQVTLPFTEFKSLRSLKISPGHRFTPEEIMDLANNCHQLEDIELTNLSFNDWNLLKQSFDTFFLERSQTLRRLSFGNSILFGGGTLLENVNFCQNLEELILKNIALAQESIESISKLCNLKTFFIHGISGNLTYLFSQMDLTNLRFLATNKEYYPFFSSEKFPNLERLIIHQTATSANHDVCRILTNSPKLKSIQFRGSYSKGISQNYFREVCKETEVFITFGKLFESRMNNKYSFSNQNFQFGLEYNLMKNHPMEYEKYQSMKSEFLEWCEFYQLYDKHPDLWISDVKNGKSQI